MKGKDSFYAKNVKRLLDILLSGIAFIIMGIPLLVISLLIYTEIGRPVFFMQDRIGKDEKKFKLFKFRSMKNAFDEFGVPLPDDQRITRIGSFIRKTSIDELPSLINIFKGDMSIIGPRPLPWNYKPWFTKEERIRHTVRGGLSGLAQVNGRATIGWEEKFAYDKEYVEHVSFLLDVKIIIDTIRKVFQRSDIGSRGLDMPPDFHCWRSGLTEKDLIEMENKGILPESYEEWTAMERN